MPDHLPDLEGVVQEDRTPPILSDPQGAEQAAGLRRAVAPYPDWPRGRSAMLEIAVLTYSGRVLTRRDATDGQVY